MEGEQECNQNLRAVPTCSAALHLHMYMYMYILHVIYMPPIPL